MRKSDIVKKLVICLALIAVVAGTAEARRFERYTGPKYVFFFIGDGMAAVQSHAAEAYLAKDFQNTGIAGKPYDPASPKAVMLNLSTLPVCGMQTTYAADRFITDSASAGTAMACGIKARDKVISMQLDKVTPANTIAEVAKDQRGMKVGIISSVSIDHATPAVFYAHNNSRSQYHNIGMQLANSNFDFFGGGGLIAPVDNSNPNNPEDAIATAIANGFTVTNSRTELAAVAAGTRVLAIEKDLDGAAMQYDIDKSGDPETMTLADFTSEAIRILDNSKGFFMMVEGGKIDWACHANDARASIDDTLAFDDAVGVALDFYEEHPAETLIIVTGDHETGGLTIGWAGTRYDNFFQVLENQNVSYVGFAPLYSDYKSTHPWTSVADDIDADMKALMLDSFGLDYDSLTALQQAKLEDGYDRSRQGSPIAGSEEDYLLYGGYDAFIVTITHTLNNNAGIAWTSYSHTGVPVPVYGIGRDAYQFEGFYDNTDIAKKLASIMKVDLNN